VFQRPRGTRDWLPGEAYRKRYVEGRLRRVFERYGYGEVITPAFESLGLLVAKAGEEVKEQIYWFKDKAGRDLGLRFELTTPVARIVAAKPEMPKPIRLYYIQPVWRYEEPQHGRYREFWQAGVELIGVPGAEGDAEVIAVTDRALREAGLEGFEIRVSDRRIVEDVLLSAGVDAARVEEAFRILDKLEKRGKEYVVEELGRLGVEADEARRVIDTLAAAGLEVEVHSDRGRRGLEHLRETVDLLEEAYSISVKVDYSIVRGLGYYTGLVFEVKAGEDIGSIAGGGRYDDLISLVGGDRLPATGMAIGVDRLLAVLESRGLLPEYKPVEAVVIPVRSEGRILVEAIKIAEELRGQGVKAVVEYGRSLRKALERAAAMGARFAVIIGPRDLEEGVATLKDLEEWRQVKLPIGEIVEHIGGALHH